MFRKFFITGAAAILILIISLPALSDSVSTDSSGKRSDNDTDQGVFDVTSGEQIDWQVISSGGTSNGSSSSYNLGSTIGQTASGLGMSSSFGIHHGFWQDFSGGAGNCCQAWGTPGDANSDHNINLLDILHTISYVYDGAFGDPPNPNGCDELLDANGDSIINLLDILYTIDYVYGSPAGPAPICPS